MSDTSEIHDLTYDGQTHELYKIYLLSLLFSILTLGLYHFWGKTRKRRYMTSSFVLEKDRFEYTGYARELLWGLVLGILFLMIVSLPLVWSFHTLSNLPNITRDNPQQQSTAQEKSKYYVEKQDPFGNIIKVEYGALDDFKFESKLISFSFQNGLINVEVYITIDLLFIRVQIILDPKENMMALLALLLIPIYFICYFFYLPFVIVYGALRYRASRLRWRGVRAHLAGSSLIYGCIGLWQTLMKVITLGFWIPVSDAQTFKYKIKKLYFGNQKAEFTPSLKTLLNANLVTIGISVYMVVFVMILGYLFLPWLSEFQHTEGSVIGNLLSRIAKEGYMIALILLIWLCYAPRYWYRAAFFRERYNALHFGNIGFICDATGWQYCKLFVLNNLIFIFTLGFGLPLIWQRRMRFFCRHVRVTGNLRELHIEQAAGKKGKVGGGFASIMNLEIGLI